MYWNWNDVMGLVVMSTYWAERDDCRRLASRHLLLLVQRPVLYALASSKTSSAILVRVKKLCTPLKCTYMCTFLPLKAKPCI